MREVKVAAPAERHGRAENVVARELPRDAERGADRAPRLVVVEQEQLHRACHADDGMADAGAAPAVHEHDAPRRRVARGVGEPAAGGAGGVAGGRHVQLVGPESGHMCLIDAASSEK